MFEQSVKKGLRLDGRAIAEHRPISLQLSRCTKTSSNCYARCEVSFGASKVLAVARGEIVAPASERPTEGILSIYANLLPMADSQITSTPFAKQNTSPLALSINNLVDMTLKSRRGGHGAVIDLETLCIVAGRAVWNVRVDVQILNNDGGLSDLSTLAAVAALEALRIPQVEVGNNGTTVDYKVMNVNESEPVRISLLEHRVCVTLGVCADGILVDLSEEEENEEGVGKVCVVVNELGEVLALQKVGWPPIGLKRMKEICDHASSVAQLRLASLATEINKLDSNSDT